MLYQNQVILSAQIPSKLEGPYQFPRRGGTAIMLEENVGKNKLPSTTVFINADKDPQIYSSQLNNKITRRTRLYIIGHGSPTDHGIMQGTDSDENDHIWTPEELAELIAKNFKCPANDYIIPDEYPPKLTISLIQCYSGVGEEDSFAGRLSDELHKRNIAADIYGRMGSVSRFDGWDYKKYVNGHYHVDGSKIRISRDVHGNKVVTPILYSKQHIFKYLARKTNTPVSAWSYSKSSKNFHTPSLAGNFWKSKRKQLLNASQFTIVASPSYDDHYRLAIHEDKIQNPLENLENSHSPINSDQDIQAFLQSLIPDLVWEPRSESQIVTKLTEDHKKLEEIQRDFDKNYPSLEAKLLQSRDTSNQDKFRIVIPIINVLNLIAKIKINQIRKLKTALEQNELLTADVLRIIKKFFDRKTYKERLDGWEDLKYILTPKLAENSKNQILQLIDDLSTNTLTTVSRTCSQRLSTRSRNSLRNAITVANVRQSPDGFKSQSNDPIVVAIPKNNGASSNEADALPSNDSHEQPDLTIDHDKLKVKEPVFATTPSKQSDEENNNRISSHIPILTKDSSTELSNSQPSNSSTQEEIVLPVLTTSSNTLFHPSQTPAEIKQTYLLNLKQEVNKSDWSSKGLGFFRSWNKTPAGIVNLRNILKDLPEIYSAKNDEIIASKFQRTKSLFEKKQADYIGFGQRHKDTKAFYANSFAACKETESETKMNAQNKI